MPAHDRRRPPVERFWEKVQRSGPDDCWLWLGARAGNYGYFWDGYHMGYSHRFAYAQFVGPIPDGLTIDHLCRTTLCVNPAHLEAVTQRENTLRGMAPAAIAVRNNCCTKGHEYTPENTHVKKDGRRNCRACSRARYAVRRARNPPERQAWYISRWGVVVRGHAFREYLCECGDRAEGSCRKERVAAHLLHKNEILARMNAAETT